MTTGSSPTATPPPWSTVTDDRPVVPGPLRRGIELRLPVREAGAYTGAFGSDQLEGSSHVGLITAAWRLTETAGSRPPSGDTDTDQDAGHDEEHRDG